jgi:hypothetical protein
LSFFLKATAGEREFKTAVLREYTMKNAPCSKGLIFYAFFHGFLGIYE